MVAPQLLVLVSLVIGGCTVISAADYAAGLPYVLYLCLLPIFAYFLFDSYYKKNQYVENTVYFAKTLMWLGFLITAEILVYYIQHPVPINRLGQGDWLDFGWGIDNNAATLLLLTAPACFFLSFNFSSDMERGANAVKRLGWIYVASGMLQYIALCFTFSRGGILAAVLTAPFVIGFTIKKSARKLNAVLPPVICFAGALAVYFAFFDKFNSMFEGLLGGGGAGWANRDKLYLEAIDCFLHNPVFGAGAGFFGVYFDPHAIRFYWFHSTFFQIIANAGLVGLAAFGYSYFVRFRILGKNIKRNAFSLFALLSLIGFELYSMIDTGTFIPFPQMTLVLLLTLFVERANAELQHERNNVLMTETYVAETICASEQTD
jgi:hypothetical protein